MRNEAPMLDENPVALNVGAVAAVLVVLYRRRLDRRTLFDALAVSVLAASGVHMYQHPDAYFG